MKLSILVRPLCALTLLSAPAYGVIINGSSIINDTQADYLTGLIGGGQELTKIFTSTFGDSLTASDFHAASDGKGDTFTLIKLSSGEVFGGYNPSSWSNISGYVLAATGAFLFNLTENTLQYQRGSSAGIYQTFNYAPYGPTFGGGYDFYVQNSLDLVGMYQYSYGSDLTYGGLNIVGDNTPNGSLYQIASMEIFTTAPQLQENATSVPDGGATLALLGLSLGGVAFVQRKFQVAK